MHRRPAPSEPGKTLAISGPTLGRHDARPTMCLAGGHFLYMGADVIDESSQLVVRAVIDPLYGTVVRAFDDHDSDRLSVLFHREDCRRFGVHLEPTGSMVNGVMLVAVTLDLDCRTADGNTLVGSWSTKECK